MGVAEKDVADLVGHAGRHTPGVTEVKQQYPALMQQLQFQQGIAENARRSVCSE